MSILICRGLSSSDFGSEICSTPSRHVALTLSPWTGSGNWISNATGSLSISATSGGANVPTAVPNAFGTHTGVDFSAGNAYFDVPAGTTPIRAKSVEAALRGNRLDAAGVEEAAALVRDEVDPLDDLRGSAAYKREMARVWTKRALLELLDSTG